MAQSSFGEALTRLWPGGDDKIAGLRAGIVASAPSVFDKYGITTPQLVAHVMAQISHECGAGHDVVENLNYTAGRMMQVWPSRFPTTASARRYAHDPKALANKVYNGRMGNAAGSDDGWNFRGRGAAQTTGREGYARLAAATGLDLVNHPDLLLSPEHFLQCGVADFIACGCLPFAKADDIVGVTRRLNGGSIGLSQRKAWLAKWKAALAAAPVPGTAARLPAVDSPSIAPEPPASVPGPRDLAAPPAAASAPSIVARFVAALAAACKRS
ncbi:glycoside hydrolase family 19 protein [Rhodopseudomonas palustris]|uniref:Putative glycohydrolase n=1 Tax=Rhodopseudomonas palustris (strain BisB18) TaxID=316056 RepID=Q217P9_RHOPB